MAFISNAERQKTSKKIYKGFGFKKWWIFTTLLIGIAAMVFLILGVVGVYTINRVDSPVFSYIALVVIIVAGLFFIVSVVLVLTLPSPQKTTSRVLKLTSSAIPGKRTNKNTSKIAKKRLNAE